MIVGPESDEAVLLGGGGRAFRGERRSFCSASLAAASWRKFCLQIYPTRWFDHRLGAADRRRLAAARA